MQKYHKILTIPALLFLLCLLFFRPEAKGQKIRQPVDPVGFATKGWQMDSIMTRIQRYQGRKMSEAMEFAGIQNSTMWKAVVCPHDDYTYAGWLYPAVLKNVKASTVILIGVAHKAKKFGIEDKIVFEDFDKWREPYGPVRVSIYREKIMNRLPKSTYIVHDSLHIVEHSLEAMIPFLQYYNRNVEIIPILVPYMPFDKMNGLALSLAQAIQTVMRDYDLAWKRDIAIVITTDAVHYGDEDWGGQNYAPYGCDSAGYRQAVSHEYEIINTCLAGEIKKQKIQDFCNYTVKEEDYHEYKWTWCGRYSVPFGLLTTLHLQQMTNTNPIKGTLIGYMNSIDHPPLPVEDIKMGKTAGASLHHWVGYAAIGYR